MEVLWSSQLEYGTEFTNVFEGCTEGEIIFSRKDTNANHDSVRMDFIIGGTATNIVDYGILDDDGNFHEFPDHIALEPFENTKTLTVYGVDDHINEIDESITIYVEIQGCENDLIAVDSIHMILHDDIYLDIFPDTVVCPNTEIKFNIHYDADSGAVSDFTLFNESIPYHFLLESSVYDENEQLYKSDSSFVFSALQDTFIYISIIDTFGCSGLDTLRYDVMEPELTDFTYIYDDPSNPNLIQFINLSQFDEYVTYSWDFGDSSGAISYQNEPQHIFPDTGTYLVGLTVSGSNVADCPLYKEVLIKPLDIPNIITPNGDFQNEYFEAFGMYDYYLTIYNRWGKKVFEDLNYKNTFKWGRPCRWNIFLSHPIP